LYVCISEQDYGLKLRDCVQDFNVKLIQLHLSYKLHTHQYDNSDSNRSVGLSIYAGGNVRVLLII
jgi:hypothetical protein